MKEWQYNNIVEILKSIDKRLQNVATTEQLHGVTTIGNDGFIDMEANCSHENATTSAMGWFCPDCKKFIPNQ